MEFSQRRLVDREQRLDPIGDLVFFAPRMRSVHRTPAGVGQPTACTDQRLFARAAPGIEGGWQPTHG